MKLSVVVGQFAQCLTMHRKLSYLQVLLGKDGASTRGEPSTASALALALVRNGK
jgi:hypothetical protein